MMGQRVASAFCCPCYVESRVFDLARKYFILVIFRDVVRLGILTILLEGK